MRPTGKEPDPPGTPPGSIRLFSPVRLGPVELRNRFVKCATYETRSRAGLVTDELVDWLLERQPTLVSDAHWQAIDAHERSLGEPHGRPRRKLASVADLLRIAHT